MSGTRCSANGKPGFAGPGEIGIQFAGTDARPRRTRSFAFPRATRRGRQGAQRDLSATTLRSGQPRSGKRGAAPGGGVSGTCQRAGAVDRQDGWLGPGCRPGTAAWVGATAHGATSLATAPEAGLPVGYHGVGGGGEETKPCSTTTAHACSRATGTRWEVLPALLKGKSNCVGGKKKLNNVRDN